LGLASPNPTLALPLAPALTLLGFAKLTPTLTRSIVRVSSSGQYGWMSMYPHPHPPPHPYPHPYPYPHPHP